MIDDATQLIGSGLVVVFAVEAAKRSGLPARFAAWLALALGALLSVGQAIATGAPVTFAGLWPAFVVGLGIGAAAAGGWDMAGRVGGNYAVATLDETEPTPAIDDPKPGA